jgi:hypothetical protein
MGLGAGKNRAPGTSSPHSQRKIEQEKTMKELLPRRDYETTQPRLEKRPVAWRVKDFADGWIMFQNENDANVYAASTGALIQGLYVRDGS